MWTIKVHIDVSPSVYLNWEIVDPVEWYGVLEFNNLASNIEWDIMHYMELYALYGISLQDIRFFYVL